MSIRLIVVLVTISFVSAYSQDFVRLRDGVSAKTRILDTAGCSVTIERNGRPLLIKKALIDYITISADTISYSKFMCQTPLVADTRRMPLLPQQESYSLSSGNSLPSKRHINRPAVFLGIVGILAGLTGTVMTIVDANTVEKFTSGNQTFEYRHQWTTAHTLSLSLSIGIIASGIGTIALAVQ